MKRYYYMAYGSNMNIEQMQYRCPDAVLVGTTTLFDYSMKFRGNNRSGVATIESEQGSEVPIVLWAVSDDDIKSLDRYEGYPYLYRKEVLPIEYKEKHIKALVYIMNEGRELSQPSAYYENTILRGYIANKLDPQILIDFIDRNIA